ncbi:MAG: hypothetical protein ACRD2X_05890 [Vicinamibacteraceae bacterium]
MRTDSTAVLRVRDHLQHARECHGRRMWAAAYEAFSAADQATPLDVDDLERLATSAYLTGETASSSAAWIVFIAPTWRLATRHARLVARSGSA